MLKKEGQIIVNLKEAEFRFLVINKLSEMTASIKKLRADIFGIDDAAKDEKLEEQIEFSLTPREFNSLVVNKLADIDAEFQTLTTVLNFLKALRENELDESSGNIFRNNADDENLGGVSKTVQEKSREFKKEARLQILADMINTYASDPGSG